MKSATKKKGVAGDIDVYLGHRLCSRRKLLGMSQEVLAEKMGITFQQIQKYENGQNRISAARLYDASIILEVSVVYFYEGYEEKSANSFTKIPDSVEDGIPILQKLIEIKDKKLRAEAVKMCIQVLTMCRRAST